MDGERLWSEKINEGNSIAPYLRQTPLPPPNHLYTHTNTDKHTGSDKSRPCPICQGPQSTIPGEDPANRQPISFSKNTCRQHI